MTQLTLTRAPVLRLLVSLAAFQAAWFACVTLAGRGQSLAATACALAAVMLHLAWSDRRRADVWLTVVSLAVGIGWDSAMARTGLVDYAAPWPAVGWAPLWILALWALFATLPRQPLRWMRGRPMVAAVFGAVGGPLSYFAASRLGACTFPNPQISLAVLGIGWAIVTPLLVELAGRLDHEARP